MRSLLAARPADDLKGTSRDAVALLIAEKAAATPDCRWQLKVAANVLVSDAGAPAAVAAGLDLLPAVVAPPRRAQPEESMRPSG
jgi:hypothetical protein